MAFLRTLTGAFMVKRHQIYDNTYHKFCLFTSSLEYTVAYFENYSFYTQHTCNQHAFRSKEAIAIGRVSWKVGLLSRYGREYHRNTSKRTTDLLICDHVDNVT
jgi:hypothetical protein